MNILIVTTSYPINEDGSEAAGSFVQDFARELVTQGHTVSVAHPGNQTSTKIQNKITLYSFAVPHLPLSTLKPTQVKNWKAILSALRAGHKTVEKAAMEINADNILALWSLPSGFWARSAAQKLNIQYSCWSLGSDIWTLGKIPVIKTVLKSVLKDSQYLYADGDQLCSDVEKLSNKPCEFLPSSRVLPRQHARKNNKAPYRLCFLGRWHENKGIDLLVDALQQLHDDDWSLIESFTLAGGGPLNDTVLTAMQKLSANSRPCRTLGYQNNKEASKLLFHSDIVIIPSRIESVPVIFSDAIQANCAVVATPVGDLPALINKFRCGLLTESTKTSDIADGIRNIIRTNITTYTSGIESATDYFSLESGVKKYINALDSRENFG